MGRRLIPRMVCADGHVQSNNLSGKCSVCRKPLDYYGEDRPLYGDVPYGKAQSWTRWATIIVVLIMVILAVWSFIAFLP